VSFRSIVESDSAAVLLDQVAARAGTSDVAPWLIGVSGSLCSSAQGDPVVSAFLDHRVLTHLLRQYELAGVDLRAIGVDAAIWARSSTSSVVAPVRSGDDGRVTLDQVRDRLDHHRKIQRRVIRVLAESCPQSLMVMFGQGIALAHPEYAERFSHDLDLVVSDPEAGHAVVAQLHGLGFVVTEARSGSYRGVPFHDWTLDADDLDEHRMHVDLSTGGVTRSDDWMRPLVLPDLFEAATTVALPDAPLRSVLVPSDTHQLLLLTEKAQRQQRYDHRVRSDAGVLLRLGRVDLDVVREAARRSALTSSLRWALGEGLGRPRADHRYARDGMNALLIRAMTRDVRRPAGWRVHHGLAARVFRRLYA